MLGRFLPNMELEIKFLEWLLHMASWRQGSALPQCLGVGRCRLGIWVLSLNSKCFSSPACGLVVAPLFRALFIGPGLGQDCVQLQI